MGVSVHCVQAVGSLLEVLHEVSTHNLQLNQQYDDEYDENDIADEPPPQHSRVLPPRIYFHAFGGKAATAIQLIRTLEKIKPKKRKKTQKKGRQQPPFPPPPRPTTKVYFGFAPIVNMQTTTRRAKTLDVIRTIGMERLVLETDHDDVTELHASLDQGIELIATALQIAPEDVIRRTNINARELYNITTAR